MILSREPCRWLVCAWRRMKPSLLISSLHGKCDRSTALFSDTTKTPT